jgi:hypothetical protein
MVLEGIFGSLVSDPGTSDPHRMVGMRRRSTEELAEGASGVDMYEPRKQVCEFNHHLMSAVTKGDLNQHGDYILAGSWAEANELANMKTKTQPQSSKEKGNK